MPIYLCHKMVMNDEQEYIKDFVSWHGVKKQIDSERKIPDVRKGEIWWCSTGINIGVEQDGKNTLFERPVLILRKFNTRLFWGVPITSQLKNFPFHYPIFYQSRNDKTPKERRALISQLRAYDTIRLTRPMAVLDRKQFKEIVQFIRKNLK